MNQEAGALRPEAAAPWPWNFQPPQLRNKCLLFRWRKTTKKIILLLHRFFKNSLRHIYEKQNSGWSSVFWQYFFEIRKRRFPFIFYVFMFDCAGSSLPWGLLSSCGKWGLYSLVAVSRAVTVLASLAAERRLCGKQASVVVAPGLSSCGTRA